MVEIKCKLCGLLFEVPPLSKQDRANGEELPDICQLHADYAGGSGVLPSASHS